MGTYKRIMIDANTDDKETIDKILVCMEDVGATKEEINDMWRKYSEETKWWPDGLVKMLSNQFPDIMFSVSYSSEGIGGAAEYWLGGKYVDAYYVLPKFPTKTVLYKGMKRQEDSRKEAERRQAEKKQRELERLEVEKQDILAHAACIAEFKFDIHRGT